MGGLFGINNKLFHEKYKFKTVKEIIKDLSGYYKERPYNVDQIFLNDNLWKIVKDDMMAHISNEGRRVYETDIAISSVPDFIGKQYRLNEDLVLEKANIKILSPENNGIFKIKSKNRELYLDLINGKVKLNTFLPTSTQLWKFLDNRLINLSNNKYLDFDKERDLIVTENNKNTWKFVQGGFIINQQNNMAIDFKGGIHDKRKEAWLYRFNHSEAQQWNCVEDCVNVNNNNKRIDQYFDQIYIIHLDELVDRKQSIIYQIKKFNLSNITIIDAFHKKDIDIEKLKEEELLAYPGNTYCKTQIINDAGDKCWCNGSGHDEYKYPGRLACAYSHYKVYDDMTKKKYNRCLILEDDFILDDNLHEMFSEIYKDIPENWDLLYLENSRKINDKKNHIDFNKNFVLTKRGVSDAGCYAITKNSASVLYNNFFPIRAAADGYIGVCIDKLFKIKNAYICKKNLSKNGSWITGGQKFKSVNDNKIISQQVKIENINKLNTELNSLVNNYDKTSQNNNIIKKNDIPKNILVLNHSFHHKNKRGLEMICDYLNYNLIYGSEKDIPDADVIYCPGYPFDVRKYPNKRFVFGPHLSIFPDNKLEGIHGLKEKNNCVYIQPSPWARDVWINWKDMDAQKFLPIESFPFPVEVDIFKPPDVSIERKNVFIMFKHRHPNELQFIEKYLKSKEISFRGFRYGSYKQEDYINYLQSCKYGIWVGRHESQGFALQEALSSDVPLLVWNVSNMRQQHGWHGCPDVYGTTIPFWNEQCGEYFYKEEEFGETYNKFLQNLDNYNPREFILETVSVQKCAENFNKLFLEIEEKEKTNDKRLIIKHGGIEVGYNSGFFSCCVVKLHDIINYFNNIKELPLEVDGSKQFHLYKKNVNDDLTHFYFKNYKDNSIEIKYDENIEFHYDYQFKNYKDLNYKQLVPFIKKYFTLSYEIEKSMILIEKKYNIDYENTCVLFYRGNDKANETKLCKYISVINSAKNLNDKNLKFLIQSDEKEFINECLKHFPEAIILNDEIRVINKCNTSVDKCLPNNFYYSKLFLAIVVIMSKCKYVITGSLGNIPMFICLYRGNSKNFIYP